MLGYLVLLAIAVLGTNWLLGPVAALVVGIVVSLPFLGPLALAGQSVG